MARILLVEGDEAIRGLAYKVLADMGHTLYEAPNGVDAIKWCCQYEIDLIISDCLMPLMPLPPFILHTSDYDNQRLRNIALNAGALAVIEKIGDIKAFRQVINQFLG